jgi:acyl dehydratase
MAIEIRFDDFEALEAAKTEEWGSWSESLEVTQDMIQAFADLTGDHQWIHVDVERAKRESPFGGPIAHGFLTLALLPRLSRTDGTRLTGYKNAVNYGSEGLRFLAPVPAGAKVHSRSRFLGVEQHKRGTLAKTEIAVHVVGSEKPSLLYTMLVLYQG